MIAFANAKINLGLNVVRRRPDGYHDLETVFYPAGKGCGTPSHPGSLCDIIEITTDTGGDTLCQSGLIADCPPENNLVMKALKAFREICAKKGVEVPPMRVALEKHIPFGAGIGGGSADASFTLMALDELCGGVLSVEEMLDLADMLGADCPFFILNRPCFAEGTGRLLTPVDLDLNGYWMALVKPDVSISTREAFSCISPCEPSVRLTDIIRLPIGEWRGLMTNDFEKSAFSLHPSLRGLKEHLYNHGASYASMSGSGSSFFGIFANQEDARRALDSVNAPHRFLTRM